MNLKKIEVILINVFASLFVVVAGSWLYKNEKFILTYTVCGAGILIIIGFNFCRSKLKTRQKNEIFFDDFEKFEGWTNIGPGGVLQSDDYAHSGVFSLKKAGANDPSGGFKMIGKTVDRGFILSGWIYRPSDGEGGPADRLGVEDRNGSGYSFGVRHEQNGVKFVIERRIEGAFNGNLAVERIEPFPGSLRDAWYYFEFQVTKSSEIVLRIDFEGQRLVHVSASDPGFKSFSRIAVHGGHPYYIDVLELRRI